MPFETLKASIYAMLDEIAGQPEDQHVLQERLREQLQQMQALGQPMPEDLVELEAWLSDQLTQPAHARSPLPPHLSGSGRGRTQGAPERRHPRPHDGRD